MFLANEIVHKPTQNSHYVRISPDTSIMLEQQQQQSHVLKTSVIEDQTVFKF